MGQRKSVPSTAEASASEDEGSKESVIYLMGRSGHGKSSLMNALFVGAVGELSHIKTISSDAEHSRLEFENGTACKFIESHELFTNGQTSLTKQFEKALETHKPTVILYTLTCSEVRSAADDIKILADYFKSRKGGTGDIPPIIIVLTKADMFYHPQLWPIEDSIAKQEEMRKLLNYVGNDILSADTLEPVQKENSFYGYKVKDCEPFRYIIPVASLLIEPEIRWNIDWLHSVLITVRNKANEAYDFQSDIHELQKVLDDVKGLFKVLCERNNVVGDAYEECRKAALRPIVEFLESLIQNARDPIVYVMGRTGHGKSSLINTLLDSPVAKVGHVEPSTAVPEEYDIVFQGQQNFWKIVDSRGIFESTAADGAVHISATKQVEIDLQKYKPDVILHVISCSEVRNMSADLKFMFDMFKTMKSSIGELPPVIVVLSKADTFHHTTQWPIKNFPDKQAQLVLLLEYLASNLLQADAFEFLEPSSKYHGCKLSGCEPFLYVIPIATLTIEPQVIWNADRLDELIGSKLPLEAWLHYYKSLKRGKSMRALALKVVTKMTAIGTAIGAIPIPGLSIIFLMPLYIIMINVIAKLAGRKFSTETTAEFLKTCSVWQGIAITTGVAIGGSFLAMSEVLEAALFGAGCVVSAPIAAGVTYGLGRAAIAYYFDQEVKAPESYTKEWTPPTNIT